MASSSTLGQCIGMLDDRSKRYYLYLSNIAETYFSLSSPQLAALPSSQTASFDKWPQPIPVGQPINLSAQLPELQTYLPLTASETAPSTLPDLPVLSSLPTDITKGVLYKTPASVKWKIQFQDFAKPTTTGAKAPIDNTTTTLPDIKPSASTDDNGGCYELLSGDLNSNSLSVLPWPEPGNDVKAQNPSKMCRAFRVQLEVSLWLQGFGKTTFTLKQALYGYIDSWSSVFPFVATDSTGSTAKNITIPYPNDPSIPNPTAGVLNPLAPFADLFASSVDTLTPDIGQPATMLLQPVDQLNKVPSQVTEIIDEVPQVKINAAIDAGAYIEGLANTVTDLLHISKPSPAVSEAEVSVGKLLGSLLSVPIAVNVKGATKSKKMKPTNSGPIPSVAAVPGASSAIGAVPIGNLQIPFRAVGKDISYDTTTTDSAAKMIISPLDGLLGLRVLPVPLLVPIGSTKPPIQVVISMTLPMDLKLPGRKNLYRIYIASPQFTFIIPTIPVPQVAMFFRSLLKDFADPDDPLNRELLVQSCPTTRQIYPTATLALAAVQKLHNLLSKFLAVLPADNPAAASKVTGPTYTVISDLLRTASTMIGYANTGGVSIVDLPYTATNGFGWTYTQLVENQHPFWTWDAKLKAPENHNISAIMWIGMPNLLNDYQMTAWLGDGTQTNGELYVPLPKSAVSSVIWDSYAYPPLGVGYLKGPLDPNTGAPYPPGSGSGSGSGSTGGSGGGSGGGAGPRQPLPEQQEPIAGPAKHSEDMQKIRSAGEKSNSSENSRMAAAAASSITPVTQLRNPDWDNLPYAIFWKPSSQFA